MLNLSVKFELWTSFSTYIQPIYMYYYNAITDYYFKMLMPFKLS